MPKNTRCTIPHMASNAEIESARVGIVMIMQVIVIRRSYHASKYLLVCVLCVGIMLFVYNPVRVRRW